MKSAQNNTPGVLPEFNHQGVRIKSGKIKRAIFWYESDDMWPITITKGGEIFEGMYKVIFDAFDYKIFSSAKNSYHPINECHEGPVEFRIFERYLKFLTETTKPLK